MYIENGIVYAGERAKPLEVCGVKPLDNYNLWVRFNNGETRMFDFTSLLSAPAFAPLRDIEIFKGVYIDYGCPVWNDGDIDIAPEYLYENGDVVGGEANA